MSLLRPAVLRQSTRNFTTQSALCYARITRDRNPNRGVSPIHRRPQKEPLGAQKYGIPKPVDAAEHTKVETDENHGLWGFFREDRTALPTPEDDHKYGRHWTVEELRQKSWEDLHKLWWACVKERNIIETQAAERTRLKPGYGDFEAKERKRTVRWTQRGIKHVLTERYYSWQEAKQLAKDDPEIVISDKGVIYTPGSALEETEEVEVNVQEPLVVEAAPEPKAEEKKPLTV